MCLHVKNSGQNGNKNSGEMGWSSYFTYPFQRHEKFSFYSYFDNSQFDYFINFTFFRSSGAGLNNDNLSDSIWPDDTDIIGVVPMDLHIEIIISYFMIEITYCSKRPSYLS